MASKIFRPPGWRELVKEADDRPLTKEDLEKYLLQAFFLSARNPNRHFNGPAYLGGLYYLPGGALTNEAGYQLYLDVLNKTFKPSESDQ
jgi:hypothetical protein